MLKLILVAAAAVICTAGLTLRANADGPYQPPIYDPGSKSYFQIINGQGEGYPKAEGPTWIEAYDLARNSAYKGARGELAEPNTFEIHSFLAQNFPRQSPSWIGLKYMCATRTLVWADGTKWKQGDFTAWAPKWNQDIFTCSAKTPTDYAPIAYNSKDDGFRWIAKGNGKRFYTYLVQYRTGHP